MKVLYRYDSLCLPWNIPTVHDYCPIGWTLLSLFHAGQQIHDVIMVFRNTVFWPISELHVSDHVLSDCSFLKMTFEKSIRLPVIFKKILRNLEKGTLFLLVITNFLETIGFRVSADTILTNRSPYSCSSLNSSGQYWGKIWKVQQEICFDKLFRSGYLQVYRA